MGRGSSSATAGVYRNQCSRYLTQEQGGCAGRGQATREADQGKGCGQGDVIGLPQPAHVCAPETTLSG